MIGYGFAAAGAALATAGYAMRLVADRQRFNRRLFGCMFATYREQYVNHLLTEAGAGALALGAVAVFFGITEIGAGR